MTGGIHSEKHADSRFTGSGDLGYIITGLAWESAVGFDHRESWGRWDKHVQLLIGIVA